MNIDTLNKKTRIPLTYVFTLSFILLFLVFLTITSFSYLQLSKVQQALESTAKRAIPAIIAYDNIADRSARLAIHTEQLSNAANPPALRIAQEKVAHETKQVATMLTQAAIDNVVQREFEAIQYELDELANLVQQRIDNISLVLKLEREMYGLFDEAKALKLKAPSSTSASVSAWFDDFSQLTVTAGSLMNYRKLNQIRKGNVEIHNAFQHVMNISETLPVQVNESVKSINRRFYESVLGQDGLIALRILQLRIEGRATGRGNFTEKLVSDFSRSINFKSAAVSNQILLNSAFEQQRISMQIQLITFFFIFSICLFIFITWLLRRRVINRLVRLKSKVSGVEVDPKHPLDLRMEDEISDIAKTFENYVDTIDRQKQELSRLALQDGLTLIANRRAFDQEFFRSFNLSSRHNLPFSILLMDVDHFKAYNDAFGHGKGDDALVKIAATLKQSLRREIDFVARYGGEEFVCILPGCNAECARVTAEQLRKDIEDLEILQSEESDFNFVTISVGGAAVSDFSERNITADMLFEEADKALYIAKGRGRNKVRIVEVQ
jgi:diguanylate cyclase (GGDEF)-like protein